MSDERSTIGKAADAGGKTAAAGGVMAIVIFLGTGGLFVGTSTFLPGGIWREVITCVFGFLFAGAFVYLLIDRLRMLFAGNDHFWRELLLSLVNVLLLIAAFAAIYRTIGIEDASGSGGPVETRSYADTAYYSVVTFTTLGYGDYQPKGAAKIMACLQAFVGYLVLGILASSSAEIIKSSAKED
jgi:hypothetical protein